MKRKLPILAAALAAAFAAGAAAQTPTETQLPQPVTSPPVTTPPDTVPPVGTQTDTTATPRMQEPLPAADPRITGDGVSGVPREQLAAADAAARAELGDDDDDQAQSEFERHREVFGRLDASGDGFVSRIDIPPGTDLRIEFDRWDTDNDGRLSQTEFDAWARTRDERQFAGFRERVYHWDLAGGDRVVGVDLDAPPREQTLDDAAPDALAEGRPADPLALPQRDEGWVTESDFGATGATAAATATTPDHWDRAATDGVAQRGAVGARVLPDDDPAAGGADVLDTWETRPAVTATDPAIDAHEGAWDPTPTAGARLTIDDPTALDPTAATAADTALPPADTTGAATAPPRFDDLDHDGSGYLTRADVAGTDLAAEFDRHDLDRDGRLTRSEYERWLASRDHAATDVDPIAFDDLDADDDDFLDDDR